ncbi:hypothetical protein EV702DRAFT_471958 [Suillus placidus]|uniref:Uncharacterized protein n=1 Tax=Suillus placidus TaxID=48579 RepID=A0A9P6ZQJ0_9AGAM|nr:hypothetical protein EV702DRAFT_471958 [Suillus placidus]
MRAGLTASPHLSGHEPRGDMDVMLSMRLQASLSSATSPTASSPHTSSSPPPVLPGSPPLSPPTSPIRASLSLEGMRSQPHTRSSTPNPPPPTEPFMRSSSIRSTKKSQSQSPNAHRSSQNSGSSSPTPSIHLQSKRSGNISPAMLSQTHSAKSSTSTTKTIKGMFTPRSRSPSLSLNGHGHERESEYAEESFGTVGSSLMGITSGVGVSTKRSSSPMRRSDSPVPSVASSGPDGSSVHLPNGSMHNGSMSNSVCGTSSMCCASINGIPACDLKIVKEDERWAPSPSTTAPLSHTLSHSHSHSHSHSLHPPPRCKKQMLTHPLADALCQQMDTSATPSMQTSAVTEDSSGTTVTPRSITPIPTPTSNPARLSVQTISTTTSTVERSGSSASSSTPSRRWSRTLPKRLTPPSGPLPLTPQTPHESEQSVSPSSAGSENPNAAFWKRTSGSSSVSSASMQRTSTVGSFGSVVSMGIGGGGSGSIGVGSKRRSMPPPRPAPSFAPPPAPEQQQQPQPQPQPQSQPQPQTQKTLFRTTVAQRALRLSLTAPRPPPSGVLPPRPDEPAYAHHRNSAESSIPTSIPPRPDSAASARSMSIKQRLRILSAPSPVIASHDTDTDLTPHQIAYPVIITPAPSRSRSRSKSRSRSRSRSPSPSNTTHSQHQTPPLPGTPITMMQNNPSFLSLNTLTPLPTIPPRNPLRASQPQRLPSAPEIRALSPPPRRGSKQLVAQCVADGGEEKERVDGGMEHELPDFSDIRVHAGSVMSLGSEWVTDGV